MSNILNKIQWIADNSKPNNDLLIRTNNTPTSVCRDDEKWFIHYTYDIEDAESDLNGRTTTVFKEYTNDLEKSLDKIIDIIKSGNREVINRSMVF